MMTEEQYKEAESFWNKKDAQVFSLSSKDVILRYQPTLLFVEHDHRFEEKIATKAVQLRKADV
jgi:hypothetical protein